MENVLTGVNFGGLFPSYLWIDIEASSLSVDSFPIEFGWTSSDLRTNSFLIRPMPKWDDWSMMSELVHGISREELEMHGIDPADAARRINEIVCGKQMLSDNPASDDAWLRQLYHDTGIEQEFTLNDSRQLEAMAATLSRLSPGEAQRYTEAVNQVFPHPHRAGPDSRREAARFLTLALPHLDQEILALA